jgi:hypothetical protein
VLNVGLLERWIGSFYGYGSWCSPYWFIGLEEGGVNNEQEFADRLNEWTKAGSPDLLDLRDFHKAIKKTKFFCGERPPFQPTWRPLMRTLFAAEGREMSDARLREYQAHRLGRFGGETTLLELSPIPAKGTNQRWFRDHELLARLDLEDLKRRRRNHLKQLIEQHKPRAVLTYGEMSAWQADLSLRTTGEAFRIGHYASSVIVASHFPGKNAPTNEHWDRIGRYIRSALGEGSLVE